jgi:hypothetical protein
LHNYFLDNFDDEKMDSVQNEAEKQHAVQRFEVGGQIRSILDLLHVHVLELDWIYSAVTCVTCLWLESKN